MSEVTSERSRLISTGIGLLVLAIFAGVAHRLPEAGRIVTGYLSVGDIIRLVILCIILSLVLSARPLLARLAVYYAHSGFRTRQRAERMEAGTHVTRLATETVNVITVAIVWPIVSGIINALLLIDVERSFDWVPIVVTIVFVVILLWRLYVAYQSLRPVLDASSGGRAKLSCPECGTPNTATAKFCSSCGVEFRPTQAEVQTQSLICPKCGAENKAGTNFCYNCGAPLHDS
jgi:hypothetical protein